MTNEQKLDALYKAVNSAWDDAFDGWDWEESEEKPGVFILGEPSNENGFTFFLAGCEDTYGGWIWVEYMPEEDFVSIIIKDRPIQPKFKEDIKNLFEKYSPFDMRVVYEDNSTPLIMRDDKVAPADLLKFFKDFRKAYDEYYPLFYMVSVSAKKWYDGFNIVGSDC